MPFKALAGDRKIAHTTQVHRHTPNQQAQLSVYGVPTAILARSIGFGPKTGLAFSSSPSQISPCAKIGISSHNRRRNTVGIKTGLVICRRTGLLHRTSDLRIAR